MQMHPPWQDENLKIWGGTKINRSHGYILKSSIYPKYVGFVSSGFFPINIFSLITFGIAEVANVLKIPVSTPLGKNYS